jgi:hypothetical protein
MPVQLSCPAFFDSYRLRTPNLNKCQTKIEQKYQSLITYSSHDFMNPESKNLFHKIFFVWFSAR